MAELERLKKRLFKQEPSESEVVNTLCEVMQVVGGYEELINLPIPTLREIIKYLEDREKQNKKMMRKK